MTLSEDARTLWQTAEALALKVAAVSPRQPPLPPLIFLTDPERTPDPAKTAKALPKGSAVIYRHFGAKDALKLAQDLRDATIGSGVKLLIGLDFELAEVVGADGVHLPERALDLAADLRRKHPNWLMTGAAHGPQAFVNTEALDALILSPVFPAGGASSAKPDLGLDRFTRLVEQAPCPVYGLGGIKPSNVRQLLKTKACGIAGVDALQTAFSQSASA